MEHFPPSPCSLAAAVLYVVCTADADSPAGDIARVLTDTVNPYLLYHSLCPFLIIVQHGLAYQIVRSEVQEKGERTVGFLYLPVP